LVKPNLSKFYEVVPYVIWMMLTVILAIVVRGDLVVTIIGGFIIMIMSLLVVPYLVSGTVKLGIFGSPCKWGLHKIDTKGYNLECRRCGKVLLDNN